MSWSISLSQVEQTKIYMTVGEAAVKQGIGFEKSLQVANAVSALAYAGGGDVSSISANGHHEESNGSGYLSVSVGYKAVEKEKPVEPAPVMPAVESGPLETSEGAVASEPAAIVEPVQDAPVEA